MINQKKKKNRKKTLKKRTPLVLEEFKNIKKL